MAQCRFNRREVCPVPASDWDIHDCPICVQRQALALLKQMVETKAQQSNARRDPSYGKLEEAQARLDQEQREAIYREYENKSKETEQK